MFIQILNQGFDKELTNLDVELMKECSSRAGKQRVIDVALLLSRVNPCHVDAPQTPINLTLVNIMILMALMWKPYWILIRTHQPI